MDPSSTNLEEGGLPEATLCSKIKTRIPEKDTSAASRARLFGRQTSLKLWLCVLLSRATPGSSMTRLVLGVAKSVRPGWGELAWTPAPAALLTSDKGQTRQAQAQTVQTRALALQGLVSAPALPHPLEAPDAPPASPQPVPSGGQALRPRRPCWVSPSQEESGREKPGTDPGPRPKNGCSPFLHVKRVPVSLGETRGSSWISEG